MTWLWATLGAILCFVFSTYVDKWLLTRYFEGRQPGVLILFSSLFAVVVVPVIWLIEPASLDVPAEAATWLVLAGLLNITAIVLYLYAMNTEEVSVIAPLFQLVPVWNWAIGTFFLGEALSGRHAAGFVVVLAGAVLASLDLSERNPGRQAEGAHRKTGNRVRLKGKPFVLMAIATLLLAVNTAVFKVIAKEERFWPSMFWQYVSLIVAGAVLFGAVGRYRREFLAVFGKDKVPIVALNVSNEVAGAIGFLLISYASLLAPVAIVSVVSSTQPMFVFVFGAAFTVFLPHVVKEDLSRRTVVQKVAAAAVIVAGAWLLNTGTAV